MDKTTKRSPYDQSLLSEVSLHFPNFCCKIPLPLSTKPWDCGWRGLPLIIFTDGQRLISSLITLAQNSFPLSDCKIVGGEPIERNKLNKKAVTSTACLEVSGF